MFNSKKDRMQSSDKIMYAENQSDYDRLLIFSGVFPTLNSQTMISDLLDIVLKLNGYDLNYWALQFKKAFWYNDSSHIVRVAEAFTVLFGLI